ncbi:ABC transporter ATP-binding protein [Halalkalibacillus halophilus]|uniref:ABC transporter ATP-binding protein n=1 Tax=Halalkalibacillus halophilus TaxID=392827 RepID=UPI003CCC0259
MIRIIEVKDLWKRFQDGTEAIKGVSVKFETNKLTCIIGPSGCGKTTLLKHLNQLEAPTSGDILIDNESIFSQDEVALRRKIGYVIQKIGLFPHMTIADNISIVPKLLKWEKRTYQKRVDEMLELVSLEPDIYANRYPLELSGGQQQRVGVARALAADPNIILMDEPFSALDPISREQLQEHLQEIQKRLKKTIVFVTHDMDEALKIADKIVLMKDGEVEQIGTPDEIVNHPANDFVRSFIGTERMQRFQKTSKRDVGSLRQWYVSEIDVPAQPVEADYSVAEAVELMVQQDVLAIEIKEGEQILGYLTKDRILEALVLERGDAS